MVILLFSIVKIWYTLFLSNYIFYKVANILLSDRFSESFFSPSCDIIKCYHPICSYPYPTALSHEIKLIQKSPNKKYIYIKKKHCDRADFCAIAYFLKNRKWRRHTARHCSIRFSICILKAVAFQLQNIFLSEEIVPCMCSRVCVCVCVMWSQVQNVNETESLRVALPDSLKTAPACVFVSRTFLWTIRIQVTPHFYQ